SIAGGSDLALHEVNEAAELVRSAADDHTNIIFGATVDERLAGQMWVTVVATGFRLGQPSPAAGRAGAAERPRATEETLLEPPSFLRGD
ncbi:MAG TPA: hypothetical protein VMU66_10550, partial [Gaiellales bacterium]|nr:hypothetical protein [Gaiellales bacterium]